MVKLLHTSDWHLGRMLYGRSLLQDQAYFLEHCFFPAIEAERPDCVVLAGDIYDRAVAPAAAIRLFDQVLGELNRMGVPLLAITGNHDGADRVVIGASLLRERGVVIASRLEESEVPLILQKDGQRVALYPLPYFEPAEARAYLGREELRGFQEAYAAVLEGLRQRLNPEESNVLVSHCFVTGCTGSDSESPLYIGGSGEVSATVFEGFDYVALGHLHAPQKAGGQGRYAGSPLKYSFDEAKQKKSLTVVEIEGKRVAARQLPIGPLHDLRNIEGDFAELLARGKEAPSEDYLFARLTDEAPIYMPMEQLRAYYPNLLGLTSGWMLAGAKKRNEMLERLTGADQEENVVFDAFMRQICQMEPTDADHQVLQEALKRAAEEETI